MGHDKAGVLFSAEQERFALAADYLFARLVGCFPQCIGQFFNQKFQGLAEVGPVGSAQSAAFFQRGQFLVDIGVIQSGAPLHCFLVCSGPYLPLAADFPIPRPEMRQYFFCLAGIDGSSNGSGQILAAQHQGQVVADEKELRKWRCLLATKASLADGKNLADSMMWVMNPVPLIYDNAPSPRDGFFRQ